MADQKPKTAPGPKVSPTRTAVSLILLLVVGVVCAIELRAGFGHMMTAKAMAAKSTDGEFNGVSLEEAKGMVALFPAEVVNTRETDTTYSYEWFSLLRPLMGEKSPQLVLVASNDEKPVAMAFATESLEEDLRPIPPSDGSSPSSMGGMGGPGMGGPGMGGPGMGGGGRKGGRPPLEGEEPAAPASETPAAVAPTVAPPSVPGSATPAPAAAAPTETPAPAAAAPPAAEAATPADPATPAAEEPPK